MKKLIVITGPSGAGLPEVVSEVFSLKPDLASVTPLTARKMKDGEQNGKHFWFFDLEGWNTLKEKGDLLETTELAGNDYGTSRRLVMDQIEQGRHVLLSVEPERAAQVKCNMPDAVCIYVEPMDPAELNNRYADSVRSSFELNARMELAAEQRASSGYCDFFVDSSDISAAAGRILEIVKTLE